MLRLDLGAVQRFRFGEMLAISMIWSGSSWRANAYTEGVVSRELLLLLSRGFADVVLCRVSIGPARTMMIRGTILRWLAPIGDFHHDESISSRTILELVWTLDRCGNS